MAILPPHLLGGALGWTVPVIAGLATLSLVLVLLVTRALPAPQKLDMAIVGIWAWTGVQLLPLPKGLIELFSPERLDVLRTRELAGLSSDWIPLSLDPGRTAEQLVVGAAIVSAFAVGRIVAARDGRRTVITMVLASTTVMACVAFAHELFAARAVYGWHEPEQTAPRLLAPLLNNNHLGGFLAFGVPLGLGLALRARDRERRWAGAVSAVLCGAGAIVAASRGAILSLTLGLALVGVVAFRKKRKTKERWSGAAVVLAGAGAMIALAAYLGLEPLFRDFEGADYSKLELAQRGLSIVATFPLVGIGRGAFAPVFARLEDSTNWATSPENLLVGWTAEWGIVATFMLLAAIIPVVMRATRSRQPEVAAAAMGVVALAAHDLVDFVLEMPGVVVVVSVLLGALASDAHERPVHEPKRTRGVRTLLALAVLVAGLVGARVPGSRPELLTVALSSGEPVRALAQRVARQHPLDPGLVLWVGHGYAREGSLRAFGWLNRAMELAPQWPSAHVQAADALARMGRTRQALLETREAETRVEGSAQDVVCRIAATASSEILLELAPEPKGPYVDRLSHCLARERIAALDAAAVEANIETTRIRARRARRAMSAGDLDLAAEEAERAVELDPEGEVARLLAAELAWRRQGPRLGLELLGTETTGSNALLQLRARMASAAGDDELKEMDLSRLRSRAAGRNRRLAGVWAFAGRLEEAEGDLGAAIRSFERAHRLAPNNSGHLANVARVAERAGQLPRANAAWNRLCEAGDARACRRRNRDRLESQGRRRQRRVEGAGTPQPPNDR